MRFVAAEPTRTTERRCASSANSCRLAPCGGPGRVFRVPRYAPGSAPCARTRAETGRFRTANVCSMSLQERRDSPFLRFLDSAPLDDESETDEERAAVAEVEADGAAGVACVSLVEIKRAYGDGSFD